MQCLEVKNELVMGAIRIRTAKQVQDEELKNLFYYRDECEHAWKAMHVCEERERDAVQIIDELKAEIDELQQQVKALTSLTHVPLMPSPVRSGTEKSEAHEITALLPFDEWKAATRVWTPPTEHKAATPSNRSLAVDERTLEMSRCISVPALLPTAMERATTALQGSVRSPTRHSGVAPVEQFPARRAVTAVGRERGTPELPAVTSPAKMRATAMHPSSPQRARPR
ncbi:hypothetical protein P43SY_009220 [Pythium insidiosum]|uniref:Uncharacterized protein n=1 Tax=Pythium insidiosum TaxID=114742 RepID=A0AAD5LLR4_PYTIN|nr:hypothetical protein P43SY_009220 [Pythium insidiosum]